MWDLVDKPANNAFSSLKVKFISYIWGICDENYSLFLFNFSSVDANGNPQKVSEYVYV